MDRTYIIASNSSCTRRRWAACHPTQRATSATSGGRTAAANGTDGTDYSRSYTAKSFVPLATLSASLLPACVMWGADGILKGIS